MHQNNNYQTLSSASTVYNVSSTLSKNIKITYNQGEQPKILPKIPKVLKMSKKKQQSVSQSRKKGTSATKQLLNNHSAQKISSNLEDKNNKTLFQTMQGQFQNNSNYTKNTIKITPFEVQLHAKPLNSGKQQKHIKQEHSNTLQYERISRQQANKQSNSQNNKQSGNNLINVLTSQQNQPMQFSHSGESNSIDLSSNLGFQKIDSRKYYQKVSNDKVHHSNFIDSLNSNQLSNKYQSQQTYYHQMPAKSRQIKRQITRSASVDMNNSQANQKKNRDYLLQNKFYQYCTDQIVKISMENQALKINLSKKDQILYQLSFKNKQMELLNQKLQNQAEISKRQFAIMEKQKKIYKKQIQKYQQKIENVPQLYKSQYKERLKEFKLTLNQKEEKILSQDKQIESLMTRIKQVKIKNIQLEKTKEENTRLRSDIAKIKKKQMEQKQKVYRKNHMINHLQEVKNVQFQNLFQILQEMK